MSVIHPSITLLKKLVVLNLEFCTSLKKFPEGINRLASLQTLKLVGCLELKELPVNLEQLKSLRNLEIDASVIKLLPTSIFLMEKLQSLYYGKLWSCTELKVEFDSALQEVVEDCRTFIPPLHSLRSLLNLEFCTSLKKLPKGINDLASVQTLELVGCLKLGKLPDNLEQLKSLRNLRIEASVIKNLPSSIFLLENLESVYCGKHWFYKLLL
ncbi:hypothetical protein FNV43_RR10354 [Rhamnella rubrinervis]|uniref:Uncharacterized protein n=1 Tax=Rhamnella rubrinervis TaxID=2594499 RepID=A0A8K0HD33_9ROSA|nr:hypothetical protein FNV43_RR10354 [Rhamnella rubrinervis]